MDQARTRIRTAGRRWYLAVSLSALALSAGCTGQRMGGAGPVVEAAPLAAKLHTQDRQVLMLDARPAEAYATGHVAGAVHVDLDAWRVDSLSTVRGLDHATQWRQRIGALGIDGRTPVIVYDDGRMTEAARVWFILQHFGVADVRVVDGGYPALTSLTGAPRIALAQTPTSPRPTTFAPHGTLNASVGLATRADVRAALERGDAQILDVRTAAEYKGADKRKNPRGGHLPTAINLPHKQLLDADGHLKSPAEVGALLQAAGVRKGEPLITHCDGGGRASLAALAAERAGYGPVVNYYLSFGDWAADATCPVETETP